jgi:multidrug efflux pump subunit AcrB
MTATSRRFATPRLRHHAGAIRGLGSSAGFTVELQDLAGNGHEALTKARDQFLKLAREDKRLAQVRLSGLDDVAQFSVDIDDRKASALGLRRATSTARCRRRSAAATSTTSSTARRVKKVYVQGDAPFRMKPDDLGLWHVRNSAARWCRSRPSPARAGATARRASSATAACRPTRSSVRPPRA